MNTKDNSLDTSDIMVTYEDYLETAEYAGSYFDSPEDILEREQEQDEQEDRLFKMAE